MGTWDRELSAEERRHWDDFVDRAREDLVHKIDGSAFVMSLAVEEEQVDIKFAVETGLAILMNKPIVVIASGGRKVPPGLARVAHHIIEVDDITSPAGRVEFERKLAPVLEEMGITSKRRLPSP